MGIQFDNHVSSADYYLQEEGYEQSRFGGLGADLLGVDGFDYQTYMRLYRGLFPETGEQLTARPRREDARSAYDITVTLPKAATILRYVMGDGRIDGAFDDANDYAMGLVQEQTCVRVRKGYKNEDRRTGNIVYLSVPHAMTRPVKSDGQPDPHGHRHNVVFNLSYDKKEGIFKAVEFGQLNRKKINDAYHKRLAKNLQKLGYGARWDGKEFTVAGITKDTEQLYSRRHAECRDAKRDTMSARTQAKLAVITRSKKRQTSVANLVKEWVSRLTQTQFDRLSKVVQKAKLDVRRSRLRASIQRHLGAIRMAGNHMEVGLERAR